jgi:sec-independent protein translocase protein TatA
MLNIASLMNPSPIELLILVGFGVLLFGRRLPEVGRSLGRGIVEFKKGLKGIGDEIDDASNRPPPPAAAAPPASLPRAQAEAPWSPPQQQDQPQQRVEEVRVSRSDKVE